jgi:hypothetical protein
VKRIRQPLLLATFLAVCTWVAPGCASSATRPGPDTAAVLYEDGADSDGEVLDEDEVVPEKLLACNGLGLGFDTIVELREGSLYWQALPGNPGAPEKTTPTEEQWRAFRDAVNRAKVLRWRADYGNPAGREDGPRWSLELKYSRHSITTRGENNYPPGRLFGIYRDAMRKLLGGRPF